MYLRQFFLTGFASLYWGSYAMGAPVVDWVTPPAWLQSQTENTPARPGMKVTGQTWIATGRGGKAVIRIDQEQVELEENSLWEWTGKEDGGTGNAVQGQARVGFAPGQSKTASDKPAADQSVRLQQNATWLLVLDVGTDQNAAEGMAAFLRFSGYPVNPAQQVQSASGQRWQIWLDGFMSPQAANTVGKSLQFLAPGIVSATPRRKPTDH